MHLKQESLILNVETQNDAIINVKYLKDNNRRVTLMSVGVVLFNCNYFS